MNRKQMFALRLLLLGVLLVPAALPSTHDQSGGTNDLGWNVIAGGGTTFSTGSA